MTVYTLLIFLAYTPGYEQGGGVALDNMRVEFFSKKQCEAAKAEARKELEKEFKRVALVCVGREHNEPVAGLPEAR